jgi:hypothetical protein
MTLRFAWIGLLCLPLALSGCNERFSQGPAGWGTISACGGLGWGCYDKYKEPSLWCQVSGHCEGSDAGGESYTAPMNGSDSDSE